MGDFIIRTIKFSLFALIFLSLMSALVWINLGFTQDFLSKKIAEVNTLDKTDILFLGSSRCYRGFDTRIFAAEGIESFNLGSSAQSLKQSYILLDEYLDQINPKMVILEVAGRSLEEKGIESNLDLLANMPLNRSIIMSSIKSRDLKTYLALLSAMVRNLIGIAPVFRDNPRDNYISGGFVERVNPSYEENRNFTLNAFNFNIREENKELLNKIKELVNLKGRTLILVYVPVLPERYMGYANRDEVDQFYRQYKNYYNFNEILPELSTIHFYNSSHLNDEGVAVFNQTLIDLLEKEGFIDQLK